MVLFFEDLAEIEITINDFPLLDVHFKISNDTDHLLYNMANLIIILSIL